MKLLNILLSTFVGVCLVNKSKALPNTFERSLHEERLRKPRFWRQGNRVQKGAIIPIRIGLTQKNLESAHEHLLDVSDPGSPNFGQHWTLDQVHDAFAPSMAAVESVREWLTKSGLDRDAIVHSENRGWLAIDIPAWQAEDLFETEYYEYESKKSAGGKVKIGCDGYHVPSHLTAYVDYITPGVALSPALVKRSFNKEKRGSDSYRSGPAQWSPPASLYPWIPPARAAALPPDLQDCGRNITPSCIRALYDIPQATRNDSVNIMGLLEAGDTYSQEDLDLFYAKYAPNVPQGTHPKLDSIDGGQAPVVPGSIYNRGESDIDIALASSLIYPQGLTLYQAGDETEDSMYYGFNPFLDALDGSYCNYTTYGITGDTPGVDATFPDPAPGGYKGQLMCGTYKPTNVISISYGASEYDNPVNYTRRQCNEFLKLGLQGVSILWASGDDGVASFPGDDSPSGCLGENEQVYNPEFATCPWITSVGATRLYANQTVLDRESAMEAPEVRAGFASSGGFANYFSAPDYQKSALSTYFASHDPHLPCYRANPTATNIGSGNGLYNCAGRGLPDVSANGANLRVFINQTDVYQYGTSLAAPIWGSMITLINQERTAIGKGPVGFLNPTLYNNSWVFNDIVNGSNANCGSKGFKAVEGWDPVTGLGTPSYPKLLQVFLSLP